MENRFNKNDLRKGKELAKEFSEYEIIHKLTIIQSALVLFYETIYNSPVLKRYKSLKIESPKEKAEAIIEDLYGDEDLLNKVYDLCWTKMSKELP